MQWYLAVPYPKLSKLYSPISSKKSRKPPENICHTEDSNKALELINPSAVFNNIDVTSKVKKT